MEVDFFFLIKVVADIDIAKNCCICLDASLLFESQKMQQRTKNNRLIFFK